MHPRMRRWDPEQQPWLECSQVQQALPSLVNREVLPLLMNNLWLSCLLSIQLQLCWRLRLISRGRFRANSENLVRWLYFAPYVAWFVLLAWMSCLLTFPSHSIWTDRNQLTGSIPSKLGELTSLTHLSLCTWIGLSCWHECHACSHLNRL
jgi:hypothetical protein